MRLQPTARPISRRQYTPPVRPPQVIPEVFRGASTNPCFFNKADIRVGSTLKHFGVLASGTVWRVENIKTFQAAGRPMKKVQVVEKVTDDITMYCIQTGDRRTMSFNYLRYSAIWWLQIELDSSDTRH